MEPGNKNEGERRPDEQGLINALDSFIIKKNIHDDDDLDLAHDLAIGIDPDDVISISPEVREFSRLIAAALNQGLTTERLIKFIEEKKALIAAALDQDIRTERLSDFFEAKKAYDESIETCIELIESGKISMETTEKVLLWEVLREKKGGEAILYGYGKDEGSNEENTKVYFAHTVEMTVPDSISTKDLASELLAAFTKFPSCRFEFHFIDKKDLDSDDNNNIDHA